MKIHNKKFKERQEEKKAAFEALAEKNHDAANSEFEHSRKMASVIPFGQPILVGHHSEKADRRYRNKISRSMDKAAELHSKGRHYEDKVKSMENNNAIRTDDPEAVKLLKEKLAKKEALILQIKEHNKKCNNVIVLEGFRFANGLHISNSNGNYKKYAIIKDDQSIEWIAKRFPVEIKTRIENFVKTGNFENPELTKENTKLPAYHLTNLNAEKSRIKKRIEEIQKLESLDDVDDSFNGIRVFTDEGRIKIDFGFKPSEEIRTELKRSGFRWSPRNETWQAYIHRHTIEKAKEVAKGAAA